MVKVLLISIIISVALFYILKIGICGQAPEKLALMKLTRTYPTWMIVCTLLWVASIAEIIIVALITVITCI